MENNIKPLIILITINKSANVNEQMKKYANQIGKLVESAGLYPIIIVEHENIMNITFPNSDIPIINLNNCNTTIDEFNDKLKEFISNFDKDKSEVIE